MNNTGQDYGDTAEYTCDSGYTLVGQTAVVCQADGTWSTAPFCQSKSSIYPFAIVKVETKTHSKMEK